MGLAAPSTGHPSPTTTDPWHGLRAELDCWAALGRTATFWWRDDDATAPTPELTRLLALQARHNVPLALAIIPHRAGDELARQLDGQAKLTVGPAVLQHGYAHQNHAPADEKSMELGRHRPTPHILAELATGQQILAKFPGSLPVLVPPWNRIAPHLLPLLPEIGLAGVSTFGPRADQPRLSGLARTNAHIDIIDWRGGRGFIGTATAIERFVVTLQQRRNGVTEGDEPTGLLTHHLDHLPAHWDFIDQLLRQTLPHPAVRWVSAAEQFGSARS